MPFVRDDLGWLSALDLARLIRDKEVSPAEVMTAVLARIDALNPALNAYCTVAAEEASDLATAAEIGVLTGEELGPLHGVPVSIKDLVFTRRMRTTAGSRLLAHHGPAAGAGGVAADCRRRAPRPPRAAAAGHRRRRVHPHPRVLLRDLRPQAIVRARALGAGAAGIGHARAYRADGAHRARRRAHAGRGRRSRRPRSPLAARRRRRELPRGLRRGHRRALGGVVRGSRPRPRGSRGGGRLRGGG